MKYFVKVKCYKYPNAVLILIINRAAIKCLLPFPVAKSAENISRQIAGSTNNISISLRLTLWRNNHYLLLVGALIILRKKTHKQRLNNWENRDNRRLAVNVLNQTQNHWHLSFDSCQQESWQRWLRSWPCQSLLPFWACFNLASTPELSMHQW